MVNFSPTASVFSRNAACTQSVHSCSVRSLSRILRPALYHTLLLFAGGIGYYDLSAYNCIILN